MTRTLRGLLLGSIALAYLYLFAHAREPLRLNVGDATSDASAVIAIHGGDSADEIHNPPLSRLVFGAVAGVAGDDVGTLRLFALMLSALASWLAFSYASRLYDRRVGLLAATLVTTSVLWMAHADSIDQAPLMQCMGFLALWGTVRAVETHRVRHQVAVGVGSFACLLTAYDYYLVLPVAVLATIQIKAGHPFARGTRRVAAICAAGCGLAIVTTTLLGHFPRIAYNRELVTAFPAIIRRVALGFTPLVWVTVGFHVVRAIRANTVADVIHDAVSWMLVAAAVTLVWLSPRGASQLVGLQVLLPFYAIGSSLVIARLLDGRPPLRAFAIAWLVAAPLWGLVWTVTQPRALLDRDDVSETNRYLAANDANDFVISNLLDDAPIEAAFGRHTWNALDAKTATEAPRQMMQIFEATGTDVIHAIIFTDTSSRFGERSLSALAEPRRLWSVLGWPLVARQKVAALIREYDQHVTANLTAVRATKVLQLHHFTVYRIDRAATQAVVSSFVATTSRIDFDTIDASLHELLGWDPLRENPESAPGTTVHGFTRCRTKSCPTMKSDHGLVVPAAEHVQIGQVMVRVDQVCDLALTANFAEASNVRFATRGWASGPLGGNPVAITIPAKSLTAGVNVIEIESLRPGALRLAAIDLACASP